MGLPYLNGKNWSDITREERYFCAELYFLIKGDETSFVKWLNTLDTMENLQFDPKNNWEVAFEVCFYRDLLNDAEVIAESEDCSGYRKFDICLFSEDKIVIIEAKAQSHFRPKQYDKFEQDKLCVSQAIDLVGGDKTNIDVYILALASSQYFENVSIYGRDKQVPEVFDGYFSWKDIYESFSRQDIFHRADNIYKK